MSFFDEVEKGIERAFRAWTERFFGAAAADDLVLVHGAILEDIEGRVERFPRGQAGFPYNHVAVRVAAGAEERRAAFEAALAADRRLEGEVRRLLEAAGCRLPAGFAVEVEVRAEASEKVFQIEYTTRAAAPRGQAPARLVLVRGAAAQPSYDLNRPRTNIGRLPEILDQHQRILRRNEVAFEEGEDTVSRRHAHIRYHAATGEYRLCDDGSEYGTSIFRDGRRIDLPKGDRRGERLRPGDELYFGRACARFDT